MIRLHGPPLGSARFKSCPEDFQVEEVLGFEPSGEGEHCLLWIEKIDRNSNDVARHIADRLGLRRRLVSHCGLKDKAAITRQWFSVHLPGKPSPTAEDLDEVGIRVLKVTRNLRKLNRGAHDGNRFLIRLRDCRFTASAAEERMEVIRQDGVPNYFGPQRFGIRGGNIEQARRMFAGEQAVNDRVLRGILISAARSEIFNRCLAKRISAGTWAMVLEGEVFGFAANHSLVLPNNYRGNESARVSDGTLELTGPLWGQGEPECTGEVKAIERRVADQSGWLARGLETLNLRQERRVMRLRPRDLTTTWDDATTLSLSFELPKGTYATSVLQEITLLNSMTTATSPPPSTE